MTPETARFLLDLLNQQSINFGHPDAEQVTAALFKARAELLTTLDNPDG